MEYNCVDLFTLVISRGLHCFIHIEHLETLGGSFLR